MFPSLDTFRISKRDSLPAQSKTSHSKSKPNHFPPTPFDISPATFGRAIPDQYSSLRAPALNHQSSYGSLTKRDPFARIGHTVSASFSGSIASFQRPSLPWLNQTVTHRRSSSGSSFGTDFFVESTPPQRKTIVTGPPANGHSSAGEELTPADSLSNYSDPNLVPLDATPPPVPALPLHYRKGVKVAMPLHKAYLSEPESGYDSPDASTPVPAPFPAHPSLRPPTRDRTAGAPLPNPDDTGDEEDNDHVGSLPGQPFGFGNHRSMNNIGGKKADKMLGLNSDAKLCSLFMISGVGPTDAAKWVPADNDLGSRVQPSPDSLGFYWRPEILGTAFSGVATEAFEKAMNQGKKMKKDAWPMVMKPPEPGTKGPNVPDAGPKGAERLISKSMKYAHPRDVEVINTSLMPNTTAHYFSFTLPSHSAAASAARTRLDSVQTAENRSVTSLDQLSSITAKQRQDLSKEAFITYYGATLTVWTSAEPDRSRQLADIRAQLKKKGNLDPVLRAPITEPLDDKKDGTKRGKPLAPWMPYRNASTTDFDGSDTETVRSGFSGSTRAARTPAWQAFGADPLNLYSGGFPGGRGIKGTVESSDVGIGPLKAGEGDTFWMPYALTLVSRHPIFDTMIDYIRTSWSMYQKSAKRNLYQMCKVLNHPVPRPGEMYRLNIGRKADGEEITIETTFPGAVDFEKGLIKTDFPLWPLFQAVDVDGILTAIEIAMSHSGKVIFTSQFSNMLCLAVHTLRYLVELRGWNGVTVPILHSRDISFMIEDPGPYIMGLPMECRYILALPNEACVIDLDNNSMLLRSPPAGVVTPRARREKVKQRIYQALGPEYPLERSIPTELKIAFPNNRFRPFHRIFYDGEQRPHFLGERLRSPPWWQVSEVITVLDKIMLDKHKKPTFMQKLTKSGLYRGSGPLSIGEQGVKDMMRRRAVHYIDARDELEIKVAKINGRLMELMQEGEKYRKMFQSFEHQADLLASEQTRLQALVQYEQEQAGILKKLSKLRSKEYDDLDERLQATEQARETAMRQLSDMQENMHDLERERQAIMDIIEDQITSAIEGNEAELHEIHNAVATGIVPESPASHISSLPDDGPRDLSSLRTKQQTLAPRGKMYRPGTTESAMTTTSRMTNRTDAISILGLARKGYTGVGGAGDKRRSMDTNGGGRDEVAIRIAAIQAKLDLALSGVSRYTKPDNVAILVDDSTDAIVGPETPSVDEAGGRSSMDEASGQPVEAEEGGKISDSGTSTPRKAGPAVPPRNALRPAPIQATGTREDEEEGGSPLRSASNSTFGAISPDDLFHSPVSRSTTPNSHLSGLPITRSDSVNQRSLSKSSARPGSRLRIRRKSLRPENDGGVSDTSDVSLSSNAKRMVLHGQGHGRTPTSASSMSAASEGEELVTPSVSAIMDSHGTDAEVAVVSAKEADAKDGMEMESERRSSGSSVDKGSMMAAGPGGYKADRLSTSSTTTVTFGPI